MHVKAASIGLLAALSTAGAVPSRRSQSQYPMNPKGHKVELGPRPQYLVEDMDEGALKDKLESCLEDDMRSTRFSIGHRGGGTLQFPEESLESLHAGMRMGAGIVECDVSFTSDHQLVCRHSACDLHTTTNIVDTDLNAKCTVPFQPAADGKEATATCCTSDITEDEFLSLCAKMDGYNASATTAADFLVGAPNWRTELYDAQCSTVLSHKQYLAEVERLGLDFTSELKAPEVSMPDGNYTYDMYRQQLVDEYVAMGIDPSRVWLQSFVFDDVAYWLEHAPQFGKQAILLDESGDTPATYESAVANLTMYKDAGVQIVSPPLSYLVTTNEHSEYVPAEYALEANRLGFEIITWSLERSPPLRIAGATGDYYYMYALNGTTHDGDLYEYVDVMVRQVGVTKMFADWSATVTFYANCFGLFP